MWKVLGWRDLGERARCKVAADQHTYQSPSGLFELRYLDEDHIYRPLADADEEVSWNYFCISWALISEPIYSWEESKARYQAGTSAVGRVVNCHEWRTIEFEAPKKLIQELGFILEQKDRDWILCPVSALERGEVESPSDPGAKDPEREWEPTGWLQFTVILIALTMTAALLYARFAASYRR